MIPRRCLISLAVGLAFAFAGGCATPPRAEDNTARWIAHPEFPAAAQAAPHLMSDILETTTRLEAQAAQRKH